MCALRELVGCQLCSITQLALWFCALPVTALAVGAGGSRPLGLSPALGALAYLLLGLGVMFSTAAAGMICWDLARLVGRGSDALVLYLRARKELAEADLRVAREDVAGRRAGRGTVRGVARARTCAFYDLPVRGQRRAARAPAASTRADVPARSLSARP